MIVTLAERKKARVDQIRRGIEQLRGELAAYAARYGGRFWLYGPGGLRYDNEVHILVDFPAEILFAATTLAEQTCGHLGLRPNIMPKSWCTAEFIQRIAPKTLVLS
jgi:hypothetical protein